MIPSRTTVRLTGIALRHQGTHDSFCAYYAAAMLLCALRPEFEDLFDATHVTKDPILGNLPRRAPLDRAVTDWLTAGVHVARVSTALNRACARHGLGGVTTRFRHEPRSRRSDLASLVRRSIDQGLPCVIGWESREMGNHTVLVSGYERYHGSPSQWLRLHDPSRVQDLVEWGQLVSLATGRLDLLHCVEHTGARPDKLTTKRDAHGILCRPGSTLERWSPTLARWEPLAGAPATPGRRATGRLATGRLAPASSRVRPTRRAAGR